MLWQPGGIVPGDQQLISEWLRAAGFSSHSAKLGLGQADFLSLEQVLADPPDVLLVAGKSRAQQHPALAEIDTLVAEFDPALLYCGGPTIPRAMERLRQIHSEVSPREDADLSPLSTRPMTGGSRLRGSAQL